MKLSRRSHIRKHWRTAISVVLAMLVMATPVLANSSNWSFTSNTTGMVHNGTVMHEMTAGTLTNSGTIYVASAAQASQEVASWRITVKKKSVWPDTTICSVTVKPSYYVGSQYAVPFSKNCGTITAGKYWIKLERLTSTSYTDGRQVVITGTLKTP